MKILNLAIATCSESSTMEADKKEFYRLIQAANYIAIDADHMLSLTEKWLQTGALTEEVEFRDSKMEETPISSPFKCQWIELSHRSTRSMAPSIRVDNKIITVLGMLVNEISPSFYDVFMVEDRAIGENHLKVFSITRAISGFNAGENNLKMILAVWMRAINSGAIGVEECNDFALIPKEKSKKNKKAPHQIRKIVRIVPKNLKDKVEPITDGGAVDFSHRWEVRGHWRRVAGIGKDRDGNYGLRGLTWVSDFVKGPEEKPLIKKLRWVPGQAS